jgi:hypothetical protein
MIYHSHAMSLYCDNTVARDVVVPCEAQPGEHVSGEFPAVFWARSKTLCRQAAKQAGWRFFADGRILCPRCVTAGIKSPHHALSSGLPYSLTPIAFKR